MKTIRKAVIPCAGFGTRFLPITKVIPKELLPIGSKPAIQYVVEEAVAAGIEEIILVCHPSKTAIVDYFRTDEELMGFLKRKGKGKEREELERIESLVKVIVATQEEPLGLGHAVLCAREAVGEEPFLLMLPDMLVGQEVPASAELLAACRESWGILLMEVRPEQVSSYGIVSGEELGKGLYRLKGFEEKPSPEKAPSNLAVLGRYVFTSAIFPLIEKTRRGALGEVQLTDAMDLLAGSSKGLGVVCRGRIFDVGTPDGLLEASIYFKEVG